MEDFRIVKSEISPGMFLKLYNAYMLIVIVEV